MAVIDQQNTTGNSGTFGWNAEASQAKWIAQQITVAISGKVSQVDVLCSKEGSPPGASRCKIYSDNGSDQPNALLATSEDVTMSTLPAYPTSSYTTYTFTTQYSVSAGTKYHLVFEYLLGDSTNRGLMGGSDANPYAGGIVNKGDVGASPVWTKMAAYDVPFKEYVIETGGAFFSLF